MMNLLFFKQKVKEIMVAVGKELFGATLNVKLESRTGKNGPSLRD